MQISKIKIIFFLILLLITSYSLRITPVSAADIDDLRAKIEERNKQIADIEKEIAQYQEELNKNTKEANTLKNQIVQLETTKKKLAADISLTQKQIEAANLNIEELGLQIGQKEKEIGEKISALAEIIRNMKDSESASVVELVLSRENFSGFFDDLAKMEDFQKEINANLSDLRSMKEALQGEKTDQEKQKKSLVNFKSKLADQKQLVEINKTNKNQLLAETKNKESNYKSILAEKTRVRDALNKELFDYESQLKYVLDPKTIPPAGSGVLSWPLKNIYITQKFGLTSSSAALYNSGMHNGVDFRASVGTEVFSAGNGVVDGTGNTDITCPDASFGKWILIKYDNGLATTYGHLSLINVSKGQRVITGQLVGYSGNTGYSTGPHLHVSVYPKDAVNVLTRPSAVCKGRVYTMPIAPINAYLDPLLYF